MTALARAHALAELGRCADALELTSGQPPDPETAALRARCLLVLDRPVEAERQAQEAIALGDDGEWPRRLLAYALLAQRRTGAAVAAARSAAAAEPDQASAHVCLSDCLRAKDLHGQALEAASEAVRLAPDATAPHVALSRSLRAARSYDRAEAAARAALERDPQDADATAALAEVLQAMHRLPEAQQVRLAGVAAASASEDSVAGLADVTRTGLLAAVALTVVVTVMLLIDPLNTPLQVLEGAVTVWFVCGAVFLGVRRHLQRRLPDSARLGLAPHRRQQDKAYVAALALPLLAITGRAVWDAARGASWSLVPLLTALTVALYVVGTRGTDRRGGWEAVGRELVEMAPWVRRLGRRGGWSELRSGARASRRSAQLLLPVLPAGPEAEEVAPAVTFARNASFLGHTGLLLGGASVAALLVPDRPWVALPAVVVVAALDAAVTDNLWPRLARRYRALWIREELHVRVVDAVTGRPPGWGRSAVRGVLRLLLLPYLLPQAVRRRAQVWVAPHDRWTGTRVVRVLTRTAAEEEAGSAGHGRT